MWRNDAWLWYLLSRGADDIPSPHRRCSPDSRHHNHSNPGRLVGRLMVYAVLIACAIELLRNR